MPRLTCAFGTDSLRCLRTPCRKCRAYADRLEAEFWRGVFFGRYNERGFTSTEWAAYQRKQATGA